MLTVEELSNKILDDHFDEVTHSNEEPPVEETGAPNNSEQFVDDDSNDKERYGVQSIDESDSLTHYGVPGMKWGVRKDKEYKPKKKDRRYDGESDQDYQNRMAREERERSSKQSDRSRVKSEKRAAKERAQTQKRMLKSQERIKQMEIKAQQKNKEFEIAERKRQEARSDKLAKEAEAKRRKEERKAEREKTKSKPVNTRTLSDRELSDAIQRLRNEQQYKQLSLQNKSLPTKTVVKAATIGGGILLAVGTAVAKKQLTDVGNQKAGDWLEKKGYLKKGTSNKGGPSITMDDVQKMVDEAIKAAKGGQ